MELLSFTCVILPNKVADRLCCGAAPAAPPALRVRCRSSKRVDALDSQYAKISLLSWVCNLKSLLKDHEGLRKIVLENMLNEFDDRDLNSIAYSLYYPVKYACPFNLKRMPLPKAFIDDAGSNRPASRKSQMLSNATDK